MNPIWKNMPGRCNGVCMSGNSASDSAGGFSQNVGLRALRRRDHELAVRVRRADDDDRVDAGIGEQIATDRHTSRGTSNSAAISAATLRVDVGHRRQPRLRDAAGEVARVDAAQPPQRRSVRR